MELEFSNLLKKHTPETNPLVMNGIATTVMGDLESYIDLIFRSVANSFPAGLTYDGYERCTYKEEYAEVVRIRNNRQCFDFAPSSVYMMKYKFSYNGVPLPDRFMYLPFVEDAGIMKLSGTTYHVVPVLSDKVISPGSNSIFIRLIRDKITFYRLYHSCRVDDHPVTSHVVHAPIYRQKQGNKVPITTKAKTCLMHYLLGKYGFTEAARRYLGFVPIVGHEEIDIENYPRDQYVICQTTGVKPKSFIGAYYNPTTIRLAIPIEHWNKKTLSFVMGFYYTLDHFPERFKRTTDLELTYVWQILIGHIVYSGLYGEGRLAERISNHYMSLDDYLDPVAQIKLSEIGHHVGNFYDLLSLLNMEFDSLILDNANSAQCMYGKNLEVLYHMAFPMTSALINVNYLLQRQATRSSNPLSAQDIIKAFNKKFKPGAVYDLTGGRVILEVVAYSGDHKYPKITSHMVAQEARPGGQRGARTRLVVGEAQRLDMSMIEAGSILFLSKANPTPTQRINPFINLDPQTMSIVPNPEFVQILEETGRLYNKVNRHD